MADNTAQEVPRWTFPSETEVLSKDDYVELETVDFSLVDLEADPATLGEPQLHRRRALVDQVMRGFGDKGMIMVVGHGLSEEEIQRFFDIGAVFFTSVDEQEKQAYCARIREEGSWAGYKPRGYYAKPGGPPDPNESFNFYPATLVDYRLPVATRPFLTGYRRFLKFNHYTVVGKLLTLLSEGLQLPSDALWRLHHRGNNCDDGSLNGPSDQPIHWDHSEDHLRWQLYGLYSRDDMDRKPDKNWIRSHTDIGTITLNYSQPVMALQILKPDGNWGWVKHKPGAIIVNLRGTMEFISGGKLKAAYHRVAEPPEDQREPRLAILYFAKPLPDIRIDRPLLDADGVVTDDQFREYRDLGGEPVKYADWESFRSKWAGHVRPTPQSAGVKRTPMDVLLDIHFKESPH